ncbi:MAG: tryptophan transporter [Proteocatella sp.]
MKNSTFTTRDLVMSAVLLGIGFVLHAVTPPLFFGIKPDFMLACMFIAIIINPNLKNTVVTGVVAGIIAALTTGFPGGQLPSVIDKVVSAIFVYSMIKMFATFISSSSKKNGFVCIASFLGTIVSGVVFLGTALLMFGLPAPFSALFVTVILPTSLANTFVSIIIFKVFGSIKAYA